MEGKTPLKRGLKENFGVILMDDSCANCALPWLTTSVDVFIVFHCTIISGAADSPSVPREKY